MSKPVDKAYMMGVALGTSMTLVPGYAFAEMGLNINGVNWYTPKAESSIETKVLNADGKTIIADTTGRYVPKSDSSEMTPEQKVLSDRVTNNIFYTADNKEIIADTTTGKYAAPTETAKWSLGKKIFWTVFGVAVVSGGAYLYSNNQHKKRHKRTTDSPNTTISDPPPSNDPGNDPGSGGGSDPPPSDPPGDGGGSGGGGGGGDL